MDRLTKQLEETRIVGNTTRPTGGNRTKDDAARADKLIHDLHACAATKMVAPVSRKRRHLVQAHKYELELEKEPQATSASPSTSRNSRKLKALSALTITAWKMNEFEYTNGTLPTMARGLFTYQDPTAQCTATTPHDSEASNTSSHKDDGGIHRILIRGYDKFFNVGEVQKTKAAWIENNTEGPYEVTLKENGCIVFMAGLPPHLVGPQGGCVISSKHVISRNEQKEVEGDSDELHAAKGREWAERSLASKGKTLRDFGLWLWNQNLTAVAELCDDSFEEHVLQYPAEKAGLYLHGLNKNTTEFETLPSNVVQEVAKEWGFRCTDFVTIGSYRGVMDFAEEIRNAGEYDNRPVEGFVVRCRTKLDDKTHFFKIKYDEPYLMYREWREVTKYLWSQEMKKAKGGKTAATTSDGVPQTMSARIKYPLTKSYIEFVKDLMQKQPELFVGYTKNQGIIAVRDMFLKEWESKTKKEQESLLAVPGISANSEEDFQRTVLIPIATIGCGKTTVSVALSKLFGWAHVSSDDFHYVRRNAGQKFIQAVVDKLQDNLVVIADRNNFELMHRERIIAGVREKYPKTRFVALHWSHDELPIERIREMEIERVKSRGNNHQSLTPEYAPEFETIIQRFLKSFEPFNPMMEPDSNFRHVVECKVGEESLSFVERIVKDFAIPTLGAGGIGNHEVPTPDEIKEAVRYAIEDWKPERVASGEVEKYYKQKQSSQTALVPPKEGDPSTETSAGTSAKVRKGKEPRYFAIAIEAGAVLRFMEELGPGIGLEDSAELQKLREQIDAWKENHRIGIHQHVTLVHGSALKDSNESRAQRATELWKLYSEEIAMASATPAMSTSNPGAPMSNPAVQEEDDGFVTVKKSGRRGKNAQPAPPARSDTDSSDPASALEAVATVDYIIWTQRIIALRISSVKRVKNGIPYDHTQAALHITVGTGEDNIKPVESNEVLRMWKTKPKHGEPARPELHEIKLTRPKVFNGQLKGMMF
ncbi:RNA ligase-domain-containing protein [Mortierella sp. GBAus27b]|nr:hypothetical protein BGX31_009521 [Mortierella sp. GBA43]KAI8351310.1 RNA ligase-domain-containing protein [Mortierella sp. GBAus27b]